MNIFKIIAPLLQLTFDIRLSVRQLLRHVGVAGSLNTACVTVCNGTT